MEKPGRNQKIPLPATTAQTLTPSLVIEAFEPSWQKEWFTYDLTGKWARNTDKLYDDKYKEAADFLGGDVAKLADWDGIKELRLGAGNR